VSGVPGTGKTATVQTVIRLLKRTKSAPSFEHVEMNGLKLTDPKQSYVVFYRHLMHDPNLRISSAKAQDSINSFLLDRDCPLIVLVLDELDILVQRNTSTLLYQFFEWATRPNSRLILIAIANRMDLPETFLLSNRLESRLGLNRINFLPYTHSQLLTILRVRLLNAWGKFDADAVELCAKKVATVSGDARKALEICKRAIEIYESQTRKDASIPLKVIHQAIQEMYSSLGLSSLSSSPFLQKIFVACLLKLSSSPESSSGSPAKCHLDRPSQPCLMRLYEMTWQYCRTFTLPIPSLSDLQRTTQTLYDSKLILLESSASSSSMSAPSLDLEMAVQFRMNITEATRVLSNSNEFIQKILVN
jgi:Cdc6-like AAA superfamily ATPase